MGNHPKSPSNSPELKTHSVYPAGIPCRLIHLKPDVLLICPALSVVFQGLLLQVGLPGFNQAEEALKHIFLGGDY